MSIFPAYSSKSCNEEDPPTTSATTTKWLENVSFSLRESQIKDIQTQNDASAISVSDEIDNEETEQAYVSCSKTDKSRHTDAPTIPLEFHGDEEFYVDKQPSNRYKMLDQLHKPACPRYRKIVKRPIGDSCVKAKKGKHTSKRYYCHKSTSLETHSAVTPSESEFMEQVGRLNRRTIESPTELDAWLKLIELQDQNPYKLSKLLLAERKVDIILKALNYNPRNDSLYHCYINVINKTYPSFEINKMIDRLLSKDPYSYTLWTAQILATQCSMARCVVPDVLKIYERCMQKMHHASQRGGAGNENALEDDVMLKLFNNCALFLRQAGLNEQCFALLKLALELNVSTDKFERLQTLDADQATLIEYEELILQSGLPMNEIWLRIERLRQAYDFLPVPLNASCSDPLRIVFNEDVCHYIYPLKSQNNSFHLVLLVLRLVKLPFVCCDTLAERFCARVQDIGDSDAVEDALAIFLCGDAFADRLDANGNQFLASVYELAKEMAVSPTFLSNHIGHELYIRCVTQLLLNCADAYAGRDERKRIALLLLLCRFERLLVALQKIARKLTEEYVRACRSRFKALLKQSNNLNAINLYTEFAMFEYETLDEAHNLQTVRNIFDNIMAQACNATDEIFDSDICHACVTYAQLLIGSGLHEEALRVLLSYIMKQKIGGSISNPKKLAALQAIAKKLDEIVAIESGVDIMVLEQYLLPDKTVSLLRMHALVQHLLGQKLQAVAYLEKLLELTFRKKSSQRSCFLRERIYELYLALLRQKSSDKECSISNAVICSKVTAALLEFPRNLYFMQCCGTLSSLPWFKIRAALLGGGNISVMSIVFLIATARYRFLDRIAVPADRNEAAAQQVCAGIDARYNESIVRNRILSVFKALLADDMNSESARAHNSRCSGLRRNSLFWRLYLRCYSDQSIPFDTSKKCLLQALDECPWSKALYMDGARYVPQELSHLQDLIIEKHMRIYALPDELEILREK